jgi:DNA-binding transcriptional ArsR family regulator
MIPGKGKLVMEQIRLFKAEFFKALSNPLRIAIIDTLRKGEHGVNEIAAALNVEQAAISTQLQTLRSKRIVKFRKEGSYAYYFIADPAIFTLLDDAAAIFRNHLIDLKDMLGEYSTDPITEEVKKQ